MVHFISLFLMFVSHCLGITNMLPQPSDGVCNSIKSREYFLPYNASVLLIGSNNNGTAACYCAATYPHGNVVLFEPNPKTFELIKDNVSKFSNLSLYNLAIAGYSGTAQLHICPVQSAHNPYTEHLSSRQTKSPFNDPVIEVPCMNLDDWCREHNLNRIDCIKIESGGLVLEILKSAPIALQKAIVIQTKSNPHDYKINPNNFVNIKNCMFQAGFELLSHWFNDDLSEEAIFIKKYITDALFK